METKRKRGQPWQRPRGIYYKHALKRPKPFLLGWSDDGLIRWQSFASADERETAAKALADKSAQHGKEVLDFDPREWRRWLEFREAAGDVEPMDILREWRATRGDAALPAGSLTVPEALAKYLEFRAGEHLSDDTRRHFKKHLQERFAVTFRGAAVRELTPDKITEWLNGIRNSRTGEPMDAVTRKHHRKDVATFLGYCVNRGWLTRNPCDLVPIPHVAEKDVELLTVEQGRALFAANAGERVVGRMALEAFGFLRASRAGRIPHEHVNLAERGLLLRGVGTKGSKARFRQGHPDNLWAWLARAPDETWGMEWWEYRNEKREAFARAGISGGSENRLRKTCLSAHLAWLKNQPLTSYLAQHRHPSTTDAYLGVMTEADGRAWFQIGPPFAG